MVHHASSGHLTTFSVTFYTIPEEHLPLSTQKNAELIQGDYFCENQRDLREINHPPPGTPGLGNNRLCWSKNPKCSWLVLTTHKIRMTVLAQLGDLNAVIPS
jgi:hypothetical protein